MMDMTEARAAIDAADRELAALFLRRMEAVRAIAEEKLAKGLPILDPAREAEKLDRAAEWFSDEALRPYFLDLLRETMRVSRDYQRALLGREEDAV